MAPTPRSAPRFRWIAAALLLALAGALAWKAGRAQAPRRILLLDPQLEAGCGLDAPQAAALAVLVKDALEIRLEAAVSQTPVPPEGQAWAAMKRDALVLRLAPRRQGDALQLGASWARVADLQAGRPWKALDASPSRPDEALEGLLAALPWKAAPPGPALVPRMPETFWTYLEAWGGAPSADYPRARNLLAAAAAEAPDCAAIAFARGQLAFFHALQAPVNDAGSLEEAESHLQEGLRLHPDHPRGVWLLARLRTDTGSLKEALEGILEARRVHPRALPLILGLTYAGRYAGLLDLSARAEALADALAVDTSRPVRLQVTFLYRGEWDRYERTLWGRPDEVVNSTVLVFRGQLHLCRGRRDLALQDFREVSRSEVGYAQFIRLGRVFCMILEGEPGARAELDALAQSRAGLRVPDGEFILNLAEAYVLLGDLHRAQEMAEKAFYTGFTCLRWFETNPILAPLRGTSRWAALMQHVRERQAFIEQRFPPRRWGLEAP